MTQYIGCDTHLKYSVFRIMDEAGTLGPGIRVEHAGGELERFLTTLPAGSPVAVEATIGIAAHGSQAQKKGRQ